MTNQPPQLELNLPADLKALYSNLVRITHSPADLVFDFAEILPGSGAPTILARVIMSPVGAKLLARALAENLSRYETTFGEIRLPGDSSLATELFGQVHPPKPPE
jgi:hypothetical protein